MAYQRRGCTLTKTVLPCFLDHSPLSGQLRAGEETEPSGVTREGEKKASPSQFRLQTRFYRNNRWEGIDIQRRRTQQRARLLMC